MATLRMHVTHALTVNVLFWVLNVPSGTTQLATAVTVEGMTDMGGTYKRTSSLSVTVAVALPSVLFASV